MYIVVSSEGIEYCSNDSVKAHLILQLLEENNDRDYVYLEVWAGETFVSRFQNGLYSEVGVYE